ncbi:exo-alpha-sialidase [Pyxidicoccus xibeiensis]|uniref:exo-alpha-sialidase n=1 Tax=Pyxidicoccus xibeiensis TaxID=2906759 RepID=UPI0020A7FD40|nr:exo-alpha-sialidase [Pyxidicoccus xibeiensis]MCP3140022.1 exo-alpha-sialidase [Pyxidicoccus xibeiensis]
MNPRNALSWRVLAALLALGPGAAAHAHAGLPETSNVTLRRGHPEDFFVGTTFGAVISRDSGKTFRWICPDALGAAAWQPRAFLWREAGDIMAASGNALLRSPDGGCTWNTHPYFASNWVTGLAAHPTDDRILYAVTGRTLAGLANGVHRSRDGGETWEATSLLRTGLTLNGVRVSSADPRRVYATGDASGKLMLLRSDDAGDTWQEFTHTLPDLLRPYDLIVEAVGPTSADSVFFQVSAQGYTHLLRSDDGGRTLTQLDVLADRFINMDLSSDGNTAWVGTLNYFFRGPSTGPLEKQPLPTGNACVLRVGETLYGCGSTWLHDWALARSTDQGTTWQPIFGLYDIQGPHHCPRGTPVRELCPARWPQLAEQLGAPLYPDGPDGGPEEPPPVDAGTPDAGTPDAGTPDAGGPTDPEQPPAPKTDGCGAAPGNAVPLLMLLSTLTTLTLGRRGRRRPDR